MSDSPARSQPSASVTALERVLLVGEAGPEEGSLHAQIDALGYALLLAESPASAIEIVKSDAPDLVIIDTSDPDVDAYRLATHIKEMTADESLPVMLACHSSDVRSEVEGLDLGADDCFARPIQTDVLAARIRLLLRNRALERSLRGKTKACQVLNQRILAAQDDLTRELELASRIQRSLLPETMPVLDRFHFSGTLRSAGAVSGDFYDVYRLDETHWGFYVADAIGHGVPAALLTIFVKKGIQTRVITADGYRLLDPGEVLTRLNRDLIDAKLSSNPFVTLFYGILDVETATVRYASGGHPPAIALLADGPMVPLLSEGALLGIFESDFTTGEHTLGPGETIVCYTDGIEDAAGTGGKLGLDALCAWLSPGVSDAHASRESFDRRVDEVHEALFNISDENPRRDDVTVLTLRMTT